MVKAYVKNAAAIMAVATIASFGMMVSAESGYTHTRTLKVGSRGLAVESLQEALNSCWDAGLAADGIFGKGVRAAVKAAQIDLGVTADGIVGKNTGGAIADCEPMDSEETDTTTDTTTGTGSTSTTLTGPEGNISLVSKLGLYNNTKVNEGSKDVAVYAMDLTIKDGDQKIDGLNVAFNNIGSGSTRFTRVASEVSIWLDGKEIGRKLASAYSDDAGNVYSYRFSGMNGIVKKDMKSQLVVAITPVSTFDTADITSDNWKVEAGNTTVTGTTLLPVVASNNSNYISAMSANGRFRDYGSSDLSESSIDFQKATGEATLRVTTSTTNPLAKTIQVSKTADTTNVSLLAFDIKAENAAMILQKLPITVTVVDPSSGVTLTSAQTVVKNVKVYINGESLPYVESAPTGLSSTIIFGNSSKLQKAIASNATMKVEVKADIASRGVTATYDEGTIVTATYSTAGLQVDLDNVNKDSVTNINGGATGESQTLRTTGAQVTMGPAIQSVSSAVVSTTVTNQTVSFKVPVKVEAFNDTVYMNKSAIMAVAAYTGHVTTEAFAYSLYKNGVQVTSGITPTVEVTSTDASQTGSIFRVDAGSARNFMLEISFTGQALAATNSNFKIELEGARTFTDSTANTTGTTQELKPDNMYQTPVATANF